MCRPSFAARFYLCFSSKLSVLGTGNILARTLIVERAPEWHRYVDARAAHCDLKQNYLIFEKIAPKIRREKWIPWYPL